MRTAVRDTSLEAYRAMAPHLGAQEARIVAFLAHNAHRDFTRAELADATGIRLSAICGRCNSLIRAQILQEGPRRPCRCTGRAAHPVKLAAGQLELGLAA